MEKIRRLWGLTVGNFKMALTIVAVMWLVLLVNMLLPFIDLRNFGIHPHKASGLIGIVFAPFLHSGFAHIIANSSALIPLLFIAFCQDFKKSVRAILIIIFVGGFGVWLFGSGGNHIGASGLVFGLITYLIVLGFRLHSLKTIIVSFVVLLLYGTALLSLLVVIPGVSWSGHFFGAASGLLAAWTTKK
jgi:membrane associated rhomboid family serine protease